MLAGRLKRARGPNFVTVKLAVVTRRQSELVKLRRQMAGKLFTGRYRDVVSFSGEFLLQPL